MATGGKIRGSDIVARMASASEPRCEDDLPGAVTQVHRDGPERRRQAVEALEFVVRRRDAAEHQLDVLAAVDRRGRHDAALQSELQARRDRRARRPCGGCSCRRTSSRRTARPSSCESSRPWSSPASIPVAKAPPIRPPMLVPAATSIGMRCSSSQRMTPTWAIPRALPPPKATPTVGRAVAIGTRAGPGSTCSTRADALGGALHGRGAGGAQQSARPAARPGDRDSFVLACVPCGETWHHT